MKKLYFNLGFMDIVVVFVLFMIVIFAFFIFQYRNSAFLNFRNVTGGEVTIKINDTKHLIKGKYYDIEFLFLFSGKARIEILKSQISEIEGDYCEIVNRPFNLCSFEIIVNKGGIGLAKEACDTCTRI